MEINSLYDPYAIHYDSFAGDVYTLDTASITLTAGTLTADTITDGTATLTGGNLSGADLDISAGTGAYTSTGTAGTGVSAIRTTGLGVYGESVDEYGVYGVSEDSYGVTGYSINGRGVYGVSVNDRGVSGFSTDNYGVYGISTNSHAGYFAGTLVATGTATVGTLTDGTATLTGGNLTGMGNYTGTGTVQSKTIKLYSAADEALKLDFYEGATNLGFLTWRGDLSASSEYFGFSNLAATGGLRFFNFVADMQFSQGTNDNTTVMKWITDNASGTPVDRMSLSNYVDTASLTLTDTNLIVGTSPNYTSISSAGVITYAGTAKRVLTVRPDLDYTKITAQGAPTAVTYGAYRGFSLPIYNNDDEELFFNANVPGRWDGASDITLDVLVALAGAETANDDFNFQLSWQNSAAGSGTTPVILDNGTNDTTVETNIPNERKEQYNTYNIEFTIDYDADVTIVSHDDLAMRLRRVAVAGGGAVEATNEIIVLDYHLHLTCDKVMKAPE